MQELAYYLVGGSESLFGNTEVSDIQDAFRSKIQSYLPNNPVVWVDLLDVRDGLTDQVSLAKELLGGEVFVVTLSSLYFDKADGEISCTRMVDNNHQSLGISHRPGSENLRTQVARLMTIIGDRKVIAVDDTLFHGDTIRLLQQLGLRVDAVVEFFISTEAAEALQKQDVPVFSAHTLDGYLDVLPIHDFLPGMPLCGKLVGQNSGQKVEYLGCKEGYSWSFPYIFPYISPQLVSEWASIPRNHVRDFSAFALQQTTILAERLKLHGINTLADVSAAQPHHTCIPYLRGSSHNDKTSLHKILRRAVHHSMS